MTNPSKKGGTFENKEAKNISLWWTDNARDDVFYSTDGSGSRQTIRRKQGKSTANSAGDLGYLDESGKPFIDFFLIEMKKGYNKDLSLLDIIDSKQKEPLLISWIKKARKEMKENDRESFLIIIRRDYKEKFVVTDKITFDILEPYSGMGDFKRLMSYTDKGLFFVVCPYDEFFQWLCPESIKLYFEENFI